MPVSPWNPDRVAYFEGEGWRAYYDHNLPRGAWLMLRLIRGQFGLAWPQAILATVDVLRAYLAFQPKDGDLVATRHFLRRFYRRARSTVGLHYDAEMVAQRELEYWIVHRVMSGDENHEPLIRSLAELHAALFGGSPAAQRESAEHRTAAAVAVDRITGKRSADVDADWKTVHDELRLAYRSVAR